MRRISGQTSERHFLGPFWLVLTPPFDLWPMNLTLTCSGHLPGKICLSYTAELIQDLYLKHISHRTDFAKQTLTSGL